MSNRLLARMLRMVVGRRPVFVTGCGDRSAWGQGPSSLSRNGALLHDIVVEGANGASTRQGSGGEHAAAQGLVRIKLSDEQRGVLESSARSYTSPHWQVEPPHQRDRMPQTVRVVTGLLIRAVTYERDR